MLSPLLFKIFTADALAVFLQQLQQLQQLQHLQQLQQYLSANEENESSAHLKELGDMFRPEQQRKRSYESDIAHSPKLQGLRKRRALYRSLKGPCKDCGLHYLVCRVVGATGFQRNGRCDL